MTGLRVTAGTLRGRRIPVPPRDVRPTSERARQAYFNIVADRVDGARFLDLFSGTGAFAFEAVSRGAAEAIAVESSRRQSATIEQLAKEWRVPVRTMISDAFAAIERLQGSPFDLVYADPPYDFDRHGELLQRLDERLLFSAGALVAIEQRRNSARPEATTRRLRFTRRVEYGEVWISLFEADPEDTGPEEIHPEHD
jgi:16S rRNA (guanine966-N2)-methyltransferase